MRKLIVLLFFSWASISVLSQSTEDLPSDFLSQDFHKGRRDALRQTLPPNSVAVFFANPIRNRANDVDFAYHQDPNFYYLTGYKEPDAVLLIFKDKQTAKNETQYDEIIFVQPRNAAAEMWTGWRLGDHGVIYAIGFELSFNIIEYNKYNVDFSQK